MKKIYLIFFILIFSTKILKADEVSDWLTKEIDYIIDSYKNESIENTEKFRRIEETINKNFAGAGIAKFAAGAAWTEASKEAKKNYIKLFKRHLALNIASMMQGYSDQEYFLLKSDFDSKNKVYLVDMQIINGSNKLLVTWRVKESKNKFYVIDLIVADISLVVTKRSEFNSMLKKVNGSLDSLNEVLKNQNDQSYKKLIKN